MISKNSRRLSRCLIATLALSVLLPTGCATRYSPGTVRQEIFRQRGLDPRATFELNLGRFTTALLKSALTTPEGDTPFEGLGEFQLAVYELPSSTGPVLDVTHFGVRGWEPVVRAHDEQRSLMILVRTSGVLPWSDAEATIGDLVVVGAGRKKAVYGRLQGSLNADLPSRLDKIFRNGGPDRIVETLSTLVDGPPYE